MSLFVKNSLFKVQICYLFDILLSLLALKAASLENELLFIQQTFMEQKSVLDTLLDAGDTLKRNTMCIPLGNLQ